LGGAAASTLLASWGAQAAGRIAVGTIGDLTNLDPFVMTFVNYPMMENVYDQFVHLDNQVRPHPSVIEEWAPSKDGLRLALKVRRDVKYHDGTTATAADVAKCIARAANADTGAHQYPSWRVLSDATAKGSDAVEVSLKTPAAYIVPALGFISLIRPSAFDALKGREGGSGPFRVREWVPGDHLDLERFSGYWDSGKPILDAARVQFYADEAALVAALEARTVDLAIGVPPREYQRLRSRFNIIPGQNAANFYYLGMNPSKPPFDNVKVRQAVACALDKKTMTRNVLFGISEPIGTPWPKFSIAHFPEFDNLYAYDLERAKRLLTEAGYAKGIQFTIETPSNFPELGQFAEILKASLAQIGSTLTIQPMDPAQWYPILTKGTFSATFSFAGGTQWFPTRIALSRLFAVSDNSVWPNGIPPKAYVDGMNRADSSFDPQALKAAMKQAVTAYMEQMWAAPVAFRFTLFGLQKYVSGFDHGVYDQIRLRDVTARK
jgi:peptide/nickel transport system substrate-binding protein